jgi:hypothetical protein
MDRTKFLWISAILFITTPASAQSGHDGHMPAHEETAREVGEDESPKPAAPTEKRHDAAMVHDVETSHEMWMLGLGGGWYLMAMAQAYPVVTTGAPFKDDHALHRTDFHLTQPAAMINVGSPGSRLVLRTTLNFEGITQSDGILTAGGWGEGFIDSRHPHTLLHEAMLSLNFWDVDLGAAGSAAFSISAGKGFAPYGTDDPMARPVLKYPTNHHLSQILERWTVNGVFFAGKMGPGGGNFRRRRAHRTLRFQQCRWPAEVFGDHLPSARRARCRGQCRCRRRPSRYPPGRRRALGRR